ncbi:MAG: transketolase [Bacteroidetes bacterium RBG_19FT_COMBO_42_10]|nr:MAG: transketolase [Bacteroidetes bacterium RBG_19FT_COMBO_42_10]
MMNKTIEELESIARILRLDVIRMVGVGQKGHLGGSCSLSEIVTVLYFSRMKHDPENPQWEDRDRFLLSKGHAALIQYAALAEAGYFPKEELDSVKKLGAMLQGHPDMTTTPGIEGNTGSLGQGLSMACGMAAGLRLDGRNNKVYCIIGDGEIAEGQIWEASMAASFYKLDNLIVFLDKNSLQAMGRVADRYDTNPLAEKWRAFGWHVAETDGHNIKEIIKILDKVDETEGKPKLIIAHTVKGKGISFAENVVAFHNGELTREQFEKACSELEK